MTDTPSAGASTPHPTSSTHLVLDDYIDRFEEAWNGGDPGDLSTFLPTAGDALRMSVLTEVVRVDLERRWSTGDHKPLEVYLEGFPELRADAHALGQIAFEEYRLRLRHEETMAPDLYARRYGVDTSTWPRSLGETKQFASWPESTVNILQEESDRLVQAIETFPSVGTNFLGFHLQDKLGEGKFSRVYLAQQGELADRQVVLKISTELWSESQKLARLQHTHIVPVYSVHQRGKIQALCMPFLGRQTLAEAFRAEKVGPSWQPWRQLRQVGFAVRRTDPLHGRADNNDTLTSQIDQERICCDFLARLADGVAHAHARGVVHRDLKPANVLITDDGQPMLLDFNLSEDVVVGGRSSLMVGGTLPYMAPEQLSAVMTGDRLDQRCDLFSLGVILFQILTGELPFAVHRGSFAESISRMIADRGQQGWQRVCPRTISVDMRSILGHCMASSPEDRYQTAEDLRDDLVRHQHDLPLTIAPHRSWSQRVSKWWRRHRRQVSFGTCAVVGGLIVTALSLFGLWQRQRIQRLDAERFMGSTLAEIHQLRMGIGLPGVPLELREDFSQRAERVLDAYGVTESSAAGGEWQKSPRLDWLDADARALMMAELRQLAGRLARDRQLQAAAASPAAGANDWLVELGRASRTENDAADEIAHCLENGEYQRALEICESVMDVSSSDTTLWHLYGVALAGVDRDSEAEDAFSRAWALNPESPLSVFARGICRLERREFEPAARDFSRTLALQPGLEEALFNRALARKHVGRLDEAIADLTDAIQERPGWTRALLARAECWDLTGNSVSATADRESVLKSSPRDELDWVSLGLTRLADDPDRALLDFEMARQCNPRSTDALQNIAHVYAEIKNDPVTAIAVLQSYLAEFDAGSPMALAGIGVLQARQGNVADSVASLEAALARSRSAQTCYQAACGFALLSEHHPEYVPFALSLLRECFLQDLEWVREAVQDPDLIGLRENEDFRRLLASATVLQSK